MTRVCILPDPTHHGFYGVCLELCFGSDAAGQCGLFHPHDLPLGGSATKAFEFNFKFNKVFLNQSQVLGHTIRTVKGKVSWTTHTSLLPGAWREKDRMVRIISVHCQLHTCVTSDELWDRLVHSVRLFVGATFRQYFKKTNQNFY